MVTMSNRPRRTDRANATEDLRATSDSIRSDVRRLDAVEEQKERLAPDDPATDRLSGEAVELAEQIERQTKAERQIVRDIR